MIKRIETISPLESTSVIEGKIINAFMELYSKKPIEKISIKKITDLAGLNRGTFYLHYQDIYDLLAQIESKYHTISKSIATYSVDALFNNSDLEDALPNKEFYKANLKYYKILLCTDNKSNLPQLIKTELKEAFRKKYSISCKYKTDLNEYALEFITSAQVATIIHWIKNDMIVPLKDLSNLMQNLAANGVIKYLEDQY